MQSEMNFETLKAVIGHALIFGVPQLLGVVLAIYLI